jgi:mannose-6-phosphate isomerase
MIWCFFRTDDAMSEQTLYPLGFDPIYQYRLWGGRRFSDLLSTPLPDNVPIGEAWLLSDRDGHSSQVTDGPLKGQTLTRLMSQFPEQLMGSLAHRFQRFPLLLKFLDAREMLSVQVHPSDAYPKLLPPGETGKTEAWVVIEAGPKSRICAGLTAGTTRDNLKDAIGNETIERHLPCFHPKPGDAVFTPAGTVHSLGGDIVVFEVQQNSDVTFRLYDWKHVDAKTGKLRALQVDQALACIDFSQGQVCPVTPLLEKTTPDKREQLFQCKPFSVWRVSGEHAFPVGAAGIPRVLVCLQGTGHVETRGATYPVEKGNTMILPAALGACTFRPNCPVTLLEIALPEV